MNVVKCNTIDIYKIVGPLLEEAKFHIENARDKMEGSKLPSTLGCNSDKRDIIAMLDSKAVKVDKLHQEVLKIAFDFDMAEGINHQYLNNNLKNEKYLEINEMNLLFSNGGESDSKEINEPVIDEKPDEEMTFDKFYKNYMNMNDDDYEKLVFLNGEYHIKETPAAFMAAIKELDVIQKDAAYGRLVYDTHYNTNPIGFKEVLENITEGTCCATFVNCALYLSGYVTNTDFKNGGKVFNANYQVYTNRVLEKHGYEQLTEYGELKEGDILLFDFDGDGLPEHTEVFAGIDPKTGNVLVYNAGNINDIRAIGPQEKKYNKQLKYGIWWAYRLPDSSESEPENQE